MLINYACSLGGLCHSAELLKRNKFKTCSYPFDWVFSNCDIITHCLENDFQIFLDKSYYNRINDNICEHTYYYKKGCGLNMFNHFNPLDNAEHYDYYVRCVNRFRSMLKAKEPKLFVMSFVNLTTIDHTMTNKVVAFNNTIAKYTTNYTLLVILHTPNKQRQHHRVLRKNNILFLSLHTLSRCNGVAFDNNNDNVYLDNILNVIYSYKQL
jgi:hypothetical protein